MRKSILFLYFLTISSIPFNASATQAMVGEVFDIIHGKEIHHNPNKTKTLVKGVESYFIYILNNNTLYVGEYFSKTPPQLSKNTQVNFEVKNKTLYISSNNQTITANFIKQKPFKGVFIGDNVYIGGDKIRAVGVKSIIHVRDAE